MIKKYAFTLVFVFVAALIFTACGKEDKNIAGDRRIAGDTVTLAILNRLGVEVVGVPEGAESVDEKYSDHIKYPRIGNAMSLNTEKIYILEPSEIIISNSTEEAFGNVKTPLENLGIRVKLVNYGSIAALKNTIEELGEYFEEQENAKQLKAELESKEKDTISKLNFNEKKPKVLVLFGAPLGSAENSIMVETNNMFGGSLVSFAGAINVVATVYPDEKRAMFSPIDWEPLLGAEPDYIFCIAHGNPSAVWKLYDDVWKTKPFNNFSVVKNGKVYYLPSSLVNVNATFDYINSLSYIVKIFNGEIKPYYNNGAVI